MKKLFSIILVMIVLLCCSSCKNHTDKEPTYLPKTELRTYEDVSGFCREYKTIYNYDEKGNVIKKTEYTKGFLGMFCVRQRQYDTAYTYNESGDISQELIRFEDFCTSITDGHQISNEGYNYVYNENQQLIKKEIINPSEHEDALCGYEYEYDEHGNLVKEYKYYADGTKKLEYENNYDSQNVLIKKFYIANFCDSSWVSEETDYTYNSNGSLEYSKTVYYAHFGEKSHYIEVKYHYDSSNRLIKEEKTSFDNDGRITTTDIIEYKNFSK